MVALQAFDIPPLYLLPPPSAYAEYTYGEPDTSVTVMLQNGAYTLHFGDFELKWCWDTYPLETWLKSRFWKYNVDGSIRGDDDDTYETWRICQPCHYPRKARLTSRKKV